MLPVSNASQGGGWSWRHQLATLRREGGWPLRHQLATLRREGVVLAPSVSNASQGRGAVVAPPVSNAPCEGKFRRVGLSATRPHGSPTSAAAGPG